MFPVVHFLLVRPVKAWLPSAVAVMAVVSGSVWLFVPVFTLLF
jgi:hypothetical protein